MQNRALSDKVFAFTLRSVLIGHDEDGDAVTSAIIEPSEPVKKAVRLKGRPLVAMQAFGDALANHGATKSGEAPPDRQCVSLDHWREYCDRHGLTDGGSDSAKRQAFGRAWKALQNKGIVCVIDGCPRARRPSGLLTLHMVWRGARDLSITGGSDCYCDQAGGFPQGP